MANNLPTEAHIRIAHSIEEQLMVSNFTSQQRRILDLILRLSWGCNKENAYIPKQRDFEIVGVREGHIKAHLDCLIRDKVLYRNGSFYSFNRNFNDWRISRAFSYRPEKLTELVSLNLHINDEKLTESVSSGSCNDLPNQEANLPNQEVELRNPEDGTYGIRKFSMPELASPKESIKEVVVGNSNINNNITTTTELTESVSFDKKIDPGGVPSPAGKLGENTPPAGGVPSKGSDDIREVIALCEQKLGVIITSKFADELRGLVAQFPLDWIKSAVEEAVKARDRDGGMRFPVKYINTTLENWAANGFKSSAERMPFHQRKGLQGREAPAYLLKGLVE
ncbi:MAG: replication protein [Dehalococcoidales bacterium]|nr:replication protein [Dehalococcoidales bacterium]